MTKHLAGIVIGFVAVIVLLSFLFDTDPSSRSPLFIDATKPRKSAETDWNDIHSTGVLSLEPVDFIPQVRITESTSEARLEIDSVPAPPTGLTHTALTANTLPRTHIDLNAGEAFTKDVASFRLLAIEMAPPTDSPDEARNFTPFDPAGNPLTPEQFQALVNPRDTGRTWAASPFPSFRFRYAAKGFEHLRFLQVRMYDERTHSSLSGGHSASADWFGMEPYIWHPAPVLIVMDIATGPPQTFDLPLEDVKGTAIGPNQLWFLHSLIGDSDYSYGIDMNKSYFSIPRSSGEVEHEHFVFLNYPYATPSLSLDLLDSAGQHIQISSTGSSGPFELISTPYPLDAPPTTLRVTLHTGIHRLFIHLPQLPGLPAANRNVENLLRVVIPSVTFKAKYDIDHLLRRSLQLNSIVHRGPRPTTALSTADFPMTFTNATLEEIAKTYARGGRLVYDETDERLVVQYPVPLSQRIRDFFRSFLNSIF